ncbi:MAG TPA: hypothetical protein VJ914_06545 [Pseudonocardiaceae bacterium]|nr:hypothetical protein [Pseudonocardiaceae bacterium]
MKHEAAAAGAPREPEIAPINDFPLCVNDAEATNRIMAAFTDAFGAEFVHETGPRAGSEDFGCFGQAAVVPSVFWNFGGFDPALYPEGPTRTHVALASGTAPINHSPQFVPTGLGPTLTRAIEAMLIAAAVWLQGAAPFA